MEKNQIISWLKIAFQQPIDSEIEDFYFDKKSNTFFSITILDKLLIDQKFKIIKNLSPYFSIEELEKIKTWIRKINKNNSSIIKLPKFGLVNNQEELEDKINSFLFKNAIRLSTSEIFEVFQKEPLFNTTDKLNIETKPWWKFW